jgi:heat shock protein HslJ
MKKTALAALLFLAACYPDETISGYVDMSDVWNLKTLNGEPVASKTTLTFPEKGKVAGQGPCNSYFSGQIAPLPWFDAGPIGATRKLCPSHIMTEETSFFAALEQADQIEVSGGVLILSQNGKIVAEFVKG